MIWLLLVIGIFVGDGLCKTYMDRSLQEKEQRPVLGGHVILRKFHNPGAMLGLGQNRRPVPGAGLRADDWGAGPLAGCVRCRKKAGCC